MEDKQTPLKEDETLARSNASGAIVSIDETKYLQRRNRKQRINQANNTDQRIVMLERQVAKLTAIVNELTTAPKRATKRTPRKKD